MSAWILTLGLAWLPLATPQAGAQDVSARVDALLEGSATWKGSGRAARELGALGPAALPVLFARLAAPGVDVRTRAVVLAALAELPRAAVLEHLGSLARSSSDEAARVAGLEVLGRLGGKGELALALELGRPTEAEAAPPTGLRTALERALAGICARETGAAPALAALFPRTTTAAQSSIAAVLGGLGGAEATSLLAGLLGSAGPACDAQLLLELSNAARSSTAEEDLLVLERVRDCFGRTDANLVSLACVTACALDDQGAVPDLIMLLEHESANVSRAAHGSLRTLTGMPFPTNAEVWLAWLDESLAWWETRADECRVALVSGTPAEAALAIRECARQRLFANEATGILALALERTEPDLVQAACRAFRALPRRSAAAALRELVAHPNSAVSSCARAALERGRAEPRVTPRRTPALPRTTSRIQ